MIENNKLIAEFLGWEIWSSERGRTPTTEYVTLGESPNDYNKELSHLHFCSNWDWLMLVVDKIESIVLPTLTIDLGYQECEFDNAIFVMYISPIEVVIDIFGDMQREKKFITANNHKDKITNTFEACIQFIKWYNENLTSQTKNETSCK